MVMKAQETVKVIDEAFGENWHIYQADCVDFSAQCPDDCIDLSIYSPPFANLFVYSDAESDMGNTADDAQFFEQYRFLIREMLRITKPGRMSCVHCKNMQNLKWRDGFIGLRDFRGEIIREHVAAGWIYHSEAVIWKDPVTEMQRTKSNGLLWKQLRKDSTASRQGMPDYMLVFKKMPDDSAAVAPVAHDPSDFPVEQWQRWASPVWMDIRQENVLNVRQAKESQDEKHLCPLQLDVIERCCVLWSNPGETVFSPFMGIGSEGFTSVKFNRKFIGTELKESYFNQAKAYLAQAEAEKATLFDAITK